MRVWHAYVLFHFLLRLVITYYIDFTNLQCKNNECTEETSYSQQNGSFLVSTALGHRLQSLATLNRILNPIYYMVLY